MAVSLVTDIVMDVIKAAEPGAAEAAHTRLKQISAADGASEPFSTHLSMNVPSAADKSPDTDAYRKFEALVLGNFIQTMLPEEADEVYGGGMSGGMWKSILAQHLGEAVAGSGGVGIADRLLSDSYVEGRNVTPLAGANDVFNTPEADENASLTTAMVQDLERRTTDALFAEGSITATRADRP